LSSVISAITPSTPSASPIRRNIYKEQAFSYFKIHQPQRKRAQKNMGKSIVSEIHPSQIPDAAEFLTRTFMRINASWFRYFLNLQEEQQEFLEQGTVKQQSPRMVTSVIRNEGTRTERQELPTVMIEKPIHNNTKAYEVNEQLASSLNWIFYMMIKFGLKYGRVLVSTHYNHSGSSEIQALSIWQHPYNSKSLSLWKMFRTGILRGVSRGVGLKLMYRLMSLIRVAEKTHRDVLDQREKPHWALYMLLVKPECQNMGVGASVLLPILKQADEASLPIYTFAYSTKPDLEQFYKRHGFDVAETVTKPSLGPEYVTFIRYSQ
jgi:ribosomal protein S18 acetylase RimI-like enzyme